MKHDFLFSTEESVCGVRAAGVLCRNGKILVQREQTGKEYALPGGHIKIGETLEQGLVREFKEETGADIVCRRLLWTEECFWEWGGKQAHSIVFYYLIDLCAGSDMPDSGEFVSQKDNCDVLLGWMPTGQLRDAVIYPAFLKEEINHLNEPPKHFISQD